MTAQKIRATIVALIKDRRPDVVLTDEARLRQDAGLWGEDLTELFWDVEEALGVKLEFIAIRTLGDLIRQAEANPAPRSLTP